MTFGFKLYNDSGDLVIDHDFQNHVIAESGSASPGGNGIFSVSFAGSYAPSRQPLLFARCSDTHVGFVGWTFSAGNIVGFEYVVKGSGTVNWKLTVTPTGPSSDAYGLRVFDVGGAIVFDSGLDYLSLVDAITVNYSGFATGNQSHASATTPYYCLNSTYGRGMAQITDVSSVDLFPAYKAINGTTVNLDWAAPRSIGTIAANWGPVPSSVTLLVADAG